jgi:hypothetical protein
MTDACNMHMVQFSVNRSFYKTPCSLLDGLNVQCFIFQLSICSTFNLASLARSLKFHVLKVILKLDFSGNFFFFDWDLNSGPLAC